MLITHDLVVSIRNRRARGEMPMAIAASCGLSPNTVSQICRGEKWRSSGGPLTKGKSGERQCPFTSEQIADMVAMRLSGASVAQIANEFAVTYPTVRKYIDPHLNNSTKLP